MHMVGSTNIFLRGGKKINDKKKHLNWVLILTYPLFHINFFLSTSM